MTKRNDRARQVLREGYAKGEPVKAIAERAGLTYGSAKVIAHRMGLVHPSGDPARDLSGQQARDYRHFTRSKNMTSSEALRIIGAAL